MSGIIGARGVGKTTFLIQYLKQSPIARSKKLYISADSIKIDSLFELAKGFQNEGGELLVIDEIHKYIGFENELKKIYDFLELQIIFSGSSALQIDHSKADLSRRAVVHEVEGLSFREFLELKNGITLPTFSLEDILENHIDIAYELLEQISLVAFQEYLEQGYYPFYFDKSSNYKIKLNETINTVLEVDIPSIFKIEYQNIRNLKKLLMILCQISLEKRKIMIKNYMKNRFKNLILEPPLFYSWSLGIRFELGSSNMWIVDKQNRVNEQYFTEALNRAVDIFDFIFKDEDEIIFVYQQFSDGRKTIGKNNFYLQQIKNLEEKELEFTDVRESKDNDVFEKKAYCLKRFAVKVSKKDINYKAILEACINSDFTIRNKRFIPHGDCYFINISNDSILHLYDDRGVDVISTHPNNLKALYKKYNEWILDYDREEIDAIFN